MTAGKKIKKLMNDLEEGKMSEKEFDKGWAEGYHHAQIKKKEQVDRLKVLLKDLWDGEEVIKVINEIFGDILNDKR